MEPICSVSLDGETIGILEDDDGHEDEDDSSKFGIWVNAPARTKREGYTFPS